MRNGLACRNYTNYEVGVGRGADQSYCILVTNRALSAETRKRIDIMCETNDGFRIAEARLEVAWAGRP